jgi:hypothetical protein
MGDQKWGKPYNARRWHIFEDDKALCDNWWFGSANEDVTEEDTYTEGSDCKECCRRSDLLEVPAGA